MKKIILLFMIAFILFSSISFAKIYITKKLVSLDTTLPYSDLQEPAYDSRGARMQVTDSNGKKVDAYHYNTSINEIIKGSAVGIINGYPDGTFRPNNSISKGDFLKIAIGLALGVNTSVDRIKSYDIPTTINHYTAPYVAIAEIQGVITPGDINDENIEDPITRIEMITILSNIQIKMKGVPQFRDGVLPNYKDINVITDDQKELVLHAAKYRLLENMESNSDDLELRPFDSLTRAEAARALMRIY